MDISIYFQPSLVDTETYLPTQLGSQIERFTNSDNFPSLENKSIALIGVLEDRGSVNNSGTKNAPDLVRKYLYKLFSLTQNSAIVDLGNIHQGFTKEDTYFALSSAITSLVKKNIIPIIIGGGQDLTYANFIAYEKLEQMVNVVSVDPVFDIGNIDDRNVNSSNYLGNIILHQPNFLFNYSNIGYQTYFVEQPALDLISKLYFDAYRLGFFKFNIEEIEPIVRNADILSFDISAIRFSDAPGCGNHSPNGFYGEDACQIMRYAGLSEKISSLGIYEINPSFDNSNQTVHLAAQMIWCFLDGFYNRKKDFPFAAKAEVTKFIVFIEEGKYEINFFKSNKSDRWWMEVPYPSSKNSKFERHLMVPCSYSDYQTACSQNLPDRWWQTIQKLV